MNEQLTPQDVVREVVGDEDELVRQSLISKKAEELIKQFDLDQTLIDSCVAVYNFIKDQSLNLPKDKFLDAIYKLDEIYELEKGVSFRQMLARVYPKQLLVPSVASEKNVEKLFPEGSLIAVRMDGDLLVGYYKVNDALFLRNLADDTVSWLAGNRNFPDRIASTRFSADGNILVGGRFSVAKFNREGEYIDTLAFANGASKCFGQFHDGRVVSGIGRGKILVGKFGEDPEIIETRAENMEVNRIETLPTGDFYAVFENGALCYFHQESGTWKYEPIITEKSSIHAISSDCVHTVTEDEFNTYTRYNDGSWKVRRDRLSSNPTGEMIVLNDEVYLGHLNKVDVYKTDLKVKGTYFLERSYDGGHFFQICYDGKMLGSAAHAPGIFLYDDGS